MLNSNTTFISVSIGLGAADASLAGLRFVLSPAPKGHVVDATHCLYLPLPIGDLQPTVGAVLHLTPDGGFSQAFDVIQVDQVPGELGHCAIWLKTQA